ncbi:MAG TPA: 3-isopropylmalate dehydratase [Euryarchaeota archaeon]|nr:3-isopropylmalate dehydratase [Euryarchaeota archaeon]
MICGRGWMFGSDIDTDKIIPGRYLDNYSFEFLAFHAMEGEDHEFASKVREGDIIVAGKNFGIGSSREQAAIALKHAGIRVIIAESFARIFYRNAVNYGLLPIISPNCTTVFKNGEEICVDLDNGRIFSSDDSGREARFFEIPSIVRQIYDAGGLVGLLKLSDENE